MQLEWFGTLSFGSMAVSTVTLQQEGLFCVGSACSPSAWVSTIYIRSIHLSQPLNKNWSCSPDAARWLPTAPLRLVKGRDQISLHCTVWQNKTWFRFTDTNLAWLLALSTMFMANRLAIRLYYSFQGLRSWRDFSNPVGRSKCRNKHQG